MLLKLARRQKTTFTDDNKSLPRSSVLVIFFTGHVLPTAKTIDQQAPVNNQQLWHKTYSKNVQTIHLHTSFTHTSKTNK